MSLQVWLPLNGNLNNQGLSNITVTNYGATVDNNGKIGKCYTLDGTDDRIQLSDLPNPKNISVAFWMKRNATTNSRQFMFTAWGGVTCEMAPTNLIHCYTNGGGGACDSTFAVTADTGWIHVVYTFEDKVGGKLYLNGVLNKTAASTTSISWTVTTGNIGNFSNMYYNGKMNDFRIYDHALSSKEVKELAKGLVLHYPLNDTAIESSTNIYTALNSISTSCYNGSTGKYGYGSNSDIYKTTGEFNGRQSMKIYMGTSGNQAEPYVYFNSLFVSDGTNQPAYKTLSFDYYGTIGTWLNFYKLGSGSGTVTWTNNSAETKLGSYTNNGYISVVPNKWNHITLTFHGITSANAEFGYGILGAAHTSSTSNYWLFANIMLEEKNHETMFTPYGTTRNDATIYDCSGYKNNGTVNGLLTVSTDTARYSVSTVFDGNSASIQIPNLYEMLGSDGSASYSISVWTYKSQIGTKSYQTILGGGSGFEIEARNAAGTDPEYVLWNWGKITAPYEFNKWNHMVFTKQASEVKLYVNGVLANQGTSSTGIVNSNYFIGAWNTATQQNYEGQMSDFRIYATALSAEDIKELYNTAAALCNNGTLMAYSFNET